MPRYKEMIHNAGIMQKDLLTELQRADKRVDKSLLSKFVNNVCLPTPEQLDVILTTIECCVFDLYTLSEIDLTKQAGGIAAVNTVATQIKPCGGKRHKTTIYNLTVEINRDIAERVFSKEAMQKLGIRDRTDFVRGCVDKLLKRLEKIEAKEKDSQK